LKIREWEGKFPHRKVRDESGRISNEEHQCCHVHGDVDEATGPENWCHIVCCEKKRKMRRKECVEKYFKLSPLKRYNN
jgi:hypothetical protein